MDIEPAAMEAAVEAYCLAFFDHWPVFTDKTKALYLPRIRDGLSAAAPILAAATCPCQTKDGTTQ